jgi:lysophospholipase L1-like esterase
MTYKYRPGQAAQTIQSGQANAMLAYQAALANRFNARCNIAVVGDSIAEGQGATTLDNRWVNHLADSLRLRYPVAGVTGGQGFIPPQFVATTMPQPVFSGAPALQAGFGPGGRCYTLTGTQSVTWTVTGTSFDVMYVQGSGAGTLGISIDGGAVQNIVETNATLTDGLVTHYAFSGPGTHTVKATAVSGTAYIDGIVVYNGDENSGITVHDCAHYGITLHNYASNTADVKQWMNALSPSLIIMALGVNDYDGQEALATFLADLNTMATAFGGLAKPCSVLLLADYDPFGITGVPWPNYVQQYYTVAQAHNYALLDMSLVMPKTNASQTYGLYYTDNIHPSNLGHSFYADNVVSALQN